MSDLLSNATNSPTIGAIVLAAGRSQRMTTGGFKLWRLISGKPMVVHTLESIEAAGIDPVVVVVKPSDALTTKNFANLNAQVIINDQHESGMHSSIQAGVRYFKRHHPHLSGFMVCLGDQPLLTEQDYRLLQQMFIAKGGRSIVTPRFRGERGNPVLIPMEFAPTILQHDGGDRGCYYLFQDYSDRVTSVEMPSDSVLFDVDTDEDFTVLKVRMQDGAGI